MKKKILNVLICRCKLL